MKFLYFFFPVLLFVQGLHAGTYLIRCKNSVDMGAPIKTVNVTAKHSQIEYFESRSKLETVNGGFKVVNKKVVPQMESVYPCSVYKPLATFSVQKKSNCSSARNSSERTLAGNGLLHKVSMIGENNIWEAPDNLSCLPWTKNPKTGECLQEVDEQLSNLIKRVGSTYIDGKLGTAFIIGQNCDRIVSTKHTLNNDDGSKRGAKKGKTPSFNRNFYEYDKKLPESLRKKISVTHNSVKPWSDMMDRKISILGESAKDARLTMCPPVPVISEEDLKKIYKDLVGCVMISYNQDGINKKLSMTMKTHEGNGTKEVKSSTRGITPCKVMGFESDGMIKTNCDSIGGASGSPMFCQKEEGGLWHLVSTHVGTACDKDDPKCRNPKVVGYEYSDFNKNVDTPLTEKFLKTLQKYNK